MRPQELLQHAAALLSPILQFTQTTEQTLAQYFRQNPKIGARERALLSDISYRVVRLKNLLVSQAEAAPPCAYRDSRRSPYGLQASYADARPSTEKASRRDGSASVKAQQAASITVAPSRQAGNPAQA